MANKVAELNVGDWQPIFEINAFKPNDLVRGKFSIPRFKKNAFVQFVKIPFRHL
jgi:hypothetical protein